MKSAEIFVAAVMLAFGLIVAFDSYRIGAQWEIGRASCRERV